MDKNHIFSNDIGEATSGEKREPKSIMAITAICYVASVVGFGFVILGIEISAVMFLGGAEDFSLAIGLLKYGAISLLTGLYGFYLLVKEDKTRATK